MSAETLRRAAALMREHSARGLAWDGDYAADKGWLAPPVALAVAAWLDFEARACERADANYPERAPQPADEHALDVARTYLQETP